ncbi:MAG: hypothetical protein ABIV48_05110 [Pyrinomonadaceae bacterium]
MAKLRSRASVHGVAVSVCDTGVLIIGESNLGKSECALELVSRGAKLVADDVVDIESEDETLYATAPERFAGLIEIRGLGIIDVRQIFGGESFVKRHKIDFCIELFSRELKIKADRIGCPNLETRFLELPLPKYDIAVSCGRNPSLLIEIAVKLCQLKGADVESELIKFHDAMVSGRTGTDY